MFGVCSGVCSGSLCEGGTFYGAVSCAVPGVPGIPCCENKPQGSRSGKITGMW